MGQPVTRKGDFCSGHDCFSPRPSIQGSPTVFVNSRPVHRVTDAWAVHCCGPSCHGAELACGSSTVFADGLQIGRVGDCVSCGSAVMTGSHNVFAGGNCEPCPPCEICGWVICDEERGCEK